MQGRAESWKRKQQKKLARIYPKYILLEEVGMFKKDADKRNITTVLAEDGSLKNEFQVLEHV